MLLVSRKSSQQILGAQCTALKCNFLVVEVELEDGETPLHIFIGTESTQLSN